ncbi:hypothetical protein EON63_04815 [archaeon]|nr:MAG: hypothetical protein EON63_04815 [archaeon]
MPRIKRLLEDYFKPSNLTLGMHPTHMHMPILTYPSIPISTLGQHLNGDEAFALGAAFRAANLSTAFRVRKIGMTDVTSLGELCGVWCIVLYGV